MLATSENKSTTNFPFLITMFGLFGIIVVLAIQNVNVQAAHLSLTNSLERKFLINFKGADGFYHNASLVHVLYESPKKIILGGYLIEAGDFNSDLWEARDLIKNQYGFKMYQVITTGNGTEASPTKVYVVMTK
ncbi:MAG TPA: hypothetical protein VH481_05435 [Nitrososphaeraceae archaeon]|jgi:hypothetical protein